MTQEEKAKAYDKAIEKFDVILNLNTVKESGTVFADDVRKIFPELKESEDEKIRKEIKDFFSRIMLGQENFLREDYDWNAWIVWLEKQCEQKSADKVEPKFHEGDWVVSPNGVYWHIDAIQDGRYQVSSDSGKCADWPLDTNIYHRFTLQDAKDGDVLFSRNSFIYGKQCPYGGLNWYTDKFIKASNFIFKDSPVHPATKEQRNLLFQKMKEAGYEWDAGKKELRKIEHNPAWSEDDESRITTICTYLQDYARLSGSESRTIRINEYCDWLKSLKPQLKQEWSKEDETALGDALWCCKQAASIAKDENDTGNVWYAERWLKSLKLRLK